MTSSQALLAVMAQQISGRPGEAQAAPSRVAIARFVGAFEVGKQAEVESRWLSLVTLLTCEATGTNETVIGGDGVSLTYCGEPMRS